MASETTNRALTSTFCHLRGIGPEREQALWKSGVTTWDDLERTHRPQVAPFPTNGSSKLLRELESSRWALEKGESDYFAERLPRREHFRLAYAFPEDTVFLDIETTGLSRYYDYITLVGAARGDSYHVYVKGCDPRWLTEIISSAKVVVTFNGTLFDLPFLLQEFPDMRVPKAHVDLRFLARRVGLTGGQKALEERLSLKRPENIKDLRGESAPLLWHRFRRGDERALHELISYNHADVHGMKGIFDAVMGRLVKGLGMPLAAINGTRFASRRAPLNTQWEVEKVRRVLGEQYGAVKSSVAINDLVYTDAIPRLRVVGIDLTGSEQRPTGWCCLDGKEVSTRLIGTDREIIAYTIAARPHLVSIDSPLSLPHGFRLNASGEIIGQGEIMRSCERTLKRRGVNVYPALIPSMRRLTARGIRLAGILRAHGIPTIESYPGAAQDAMNIPRKRASLELLEAGLKEFGVVGEFLRQHVSHDELDAITSAIVGVFFWSGRFERLGPDAHGDEALIIPDLKADPLPWRNRVIIGLSGQLASGKTTAARALAAMGLHYGRYSMMIERLLKDSESAPNRTALQDEGRRVHVEKGQRWLGGELLRILPTEGNYVIDGLRFPEDHAFLSEVFGPAFVHVHIGAPDRERLRRYVGRGGAVAEFRRAESHDVESGVSKLRELARVVVDNKAGQEDFLSTIRRLVNSPDGIPCQLQW